MVDEKNSQFSYSGYLIFNGLYTTDIQGEFEGVETQEELTSQLEEKLPSLSAEYPNGPRTGYRDLELAKFLREYDYSAEDSRLHQRHKDIAEELIAKEFVQEEFGQEVSIVSNETRQTGPKVDKQNAYVYWQLPDLLMIQGAKPEAQQTLRHLFQSLGIADSRDELYTKIRPLEFDPHFLLWLIYQDHEDNSIGSGISLHNISHVKVQGEADFFGESAQVTGSTDIIRSTPFIEGLLKNKLPVQLVGTFEAGGQTLVADISEQGRIHIKADEDIDRSTKLERLLIALHFTKEITALRQDWEFMDPKRKYVPPEFAEKLDEYASEQGVNIDFRRDLVQELANERGESVSDLDLAF